MDEVAMRRDLAEIFLKKYMPLHEQALHTNAMSDDEFVAMVEANIARAPDLIRDPEDKTRERILARREPARFTDLTEVERMVQRDIEKILPFLIRSRKSSGQEGPVSEDEANAAHFDSLSAQRQKPGEFMREKLATTEDPVRQFRLSALLENFLRNEPDLESLRGDVSEDQLKEVTERMMARNRAMFEKLMEHRKGLSQPQPGSNDPNSTTD
jgi:hypothetical protein